MRDNDYIRPVSRRKFITCAGGASLSLLGLRALLTIIKVKMRNLPRGLHSFTFRTVLHVVGSFLERVIARCLVSRVKNNVWRFEGKTVPPGSHPLTLTPTLAPLHKMRKKVSLITGMDRTFQHGTDSHAQCASCFLTSVAPYEVENSAYPLTRTLDHIAADSIGQNTPYSTLELSRNDHKNNIESIYFDNMSWYGTGHVAPSMRNPRKVYDRLFGTQAHSRFRNITDLALSNASQLKKRLSVDDRQKFGEYLESIRTIEVRMDRIDKMKSDLAEARIERPAEHLPRNEYIHLMGDLLVTALQNGLTNVGTLMLGPERWTTPTNWEGILDKPYSHHAMTHAIGNHLEHLLVLDRFHVSAFARLLERMDQIKENNDTTLLDNTIFTLGAGMGDGTTHQYNDLPLVVAGGGGGKLKWVITFIVKGELLWRISG